MSEEDAEQSFAKGDRAAIVSGKQDVGVRGEIFWTGENKYGPGMRYGLRGDDGGTYWVDETNIGPEEGAPPPPERPASTGPALEKGDTVEIVGGQDAGKRGEIFWVGESKFGKGMRYGIRADDQETYWADEALVVSVDGGAGGQPEGVAPEPPPLDDAPLPSDDDLAYADAAGPGFPDDEDIPF